MPSNSHDINNSSATATHVINDNSATHDSSATHDINDDSVARAGFTSDDTTAGTAAPGLPQAGQEHRSGDVRGAA